MCFMIYTNRGSSYELRKYLRVRAIRNAQEIDVCQHRYPIIAGILNLLIHRLGEPRLLCILPKSRMTTGLGPPQS